MTGPISFGFRPGDVVIVTGAGSGIGRATALAAAAAGLAVSAWDRDGDTAAATSEVITERGGTSTAVTADVGIDEQVGSALDRAAQLGPLQYLVNNAGPPSAVELAFDEAVLTCVGSVRRVTSAWLGRAAGPDRALVNVASVAGTALGTAPDWYPTSKAAILGYTRHLATYRVGEVRANAVAPGMIDTPRLAGFAESPVGRRALERVPLGRLGRPEEIAYAILFLISPLAAYVNGSMLTVDGGWTIAQ